MKAKTQEQENAKVFIKMGEYVNIKVTRKSQRGIVAKKFLEIIEEEKLAKFEAQLPKFSFQTIKVNQGSQAFYL